MRRGFDRTSTDTGISAVLAQHLLSQLIPCPSNYFLDNASDGKPDGCPCGCVKLIHYGFTYIGKTKVKHFLICSNQEYHWSSHQIMSGVSDIKSNFLSFNTKSTIGLKKKSIYYYYLLLLNITNEFVLFSVNKVLRWAMWPMGHSWYNIAMLVNSCKIYTYACYSGHLSVLLLMCHFYQNLTV